ncbi:MAG TPA: PQQ-binding-like beta-propeller repeat protein, partial [Gemmataceae bacterium]|nr:PQQ-binding-like beta-propeller repeat protein [Gemmataceae bacterium]
TVIISFTSSHAADWPQFRGSNGSGVSDETALPIKWSKTEGMRWKADLPGRGLSNPVIAGGKVYVTASSGYQENRLHVLCFEEKTGKKLWERQIWTTGGTGCHPKSCMAAPTPCVDGKAVYALFATGDLVCYEADGTLRWYRSLTGDYPTITNQVGMAASPILAKDLLIVPMDNEGESFLAGIDIKTGKNRWKIERPRGINWVTPALRRAGNTEEILFQAGSELVAYDLATGAPRWTYSADSLSTIPSPIVAGNLVVVPGKETAVLRPKENLSTPDVVWTSVKAKATGFATPLFYKDKIFTLGGAVLVCADAANGKAKWDLRLKGPIDASPVGADGRLYIVNEKGLTQVVQLGEQPEIIAENNLNDDILATPAIANGAIYLRSDKMLYCIGKK